MDFIALDVETANPDLSSICQIGLVRFANGVVVETWESLVDPQDYFDFWNVSVHGIDESQVVGAPKWHELCADVCQRIGSAVVVSHTPFDRRSLGSAFAKHSYEPPAMRWLDSARVVRRTWADLSQRGYGLSNVAKRLGIQFRHHNAAEDARAAGEILIHAMRESGLTLEEWVIKAVARRVYSRSSSKEDVKRDGDPDGHLFGETIVFTGAICIPRREAADIAAAAGCNVGENVTRATTLLVVGDQDLRKLSGEEKSKKHRLAEAAQANGQPIRILTESDFLAIVECEA